MSFGELARVVAILLVLMKTSYAAENLAFICVCLKVIFHSRQIKLHGNSLEGLQIPGVTPCWIIMEFSEYLW